jgi:hypothetical protein
MPLYGLVADSPVIYAAQKLGNRIHIPHGSGRSGRSGMSYQLKGVYLYPGVFDNFVNGRHGDVGRSMQALGRTIQVAARHQAGMKTGKLRASIRVDHSSNRLGHTLRIGSSVSYALAHHEGTKPHIITPKNNEVLRFSTGTRVIYTKQVHHPGTKANRYLSDQLRIFIPR